MRLPAALRQGAAVSFSSDPLSLQIAYKYGFFGWTQDTVNYLCSHSGPLLGCQLQDRIYIHRARLHCAVLHVKLPIRELSQRSESMFAKLQDLFSEK